MAVLAGFAIVLVPTVFTLFPEWTRWSPAARAFVLLAWLSAVGIVVLAGIRQSERIEDLIRPGRRRREQARHVAGQRLLRSLLLPESAGFPAHCEFRVFLPDAARGRLMPEYESPGSDPSEGWEPGKGVVGAAFSTASLIRAHGPPIWDGSYGLTVDQQVKYRSLWAIVATPLLNARVVPIGVLAVSTSVEDPFVVGDPAAHMLLELAEVVARVLIDIFRVGGD